MPKTAVLPYRLFVFLGGGEMINNYNEIFRKENDDESGVRNATMCVCVGGGGSATNDSMAALII
jgi:hypothetical protein